MTVKLYTRRLVRNFREYLEVITEEHRERLALKIYPEFRLWIREAEAHSYNRGYQAHETIRQIEAALEDYKKDQPKKAHPSAVAKKTTKTNK